MIFETFSTTAASASASPLRISVLRMSIIVEEVDTKESSLVRKRLQVRRIGTRVLIPSSEVIIPSDWLAERDNSRLPRNFGKPEPMNLTCAFSYPEE
jgi:hypothetical protein